MATLTAFEKLNMDNTSVWYGDITVADHNHIQITAGSSIQNYFGSFYYDYYGLAGGTVSSSNYIENNITIWEITGGNYSALAVEYYLDYADSETLLDYVLSDNDRINGSLHDDTLRGYGGNDQIFGNDGEDMLRGASGDDYLDGGSGVDTALYFYSSSFYTVSKTTTNFSISGSEGTDSLIDIERLQFSDKAIAIDIDGNGGQAYRLYQAAFDRSPDLVGLGYWINEIDNGMSLLQVANGFIQSAEFQGLYGPNPSDEQFVSLLYNNVLNRPLDEDGFAYWTDELAKGVNTRDGVLVGFSESAENQAQVIGVIQDGFEYIVW